MKRIVVTGLGIVSPLGIGTGKNWKKLIQGDCGIRSLKGKSQGIYDELPSTIAGIVPEEDVRLNNNKDIVNTRTMATFIQYAMIAAHEALNDAKWFPDNENEKRRTGVAVGSGIGSIEEIMVASEHICNKTIRKISPYFIPKMLVNMAAGHISIKYGFQGPNHSVATACATGAHALGDAMRFIQFGDADVMVAGSSESAINPLSIAGFSRAQALSTKFNSLPTKASRPFDKDRDGFVIGEGAGIVILEDYDHAKKRGATMYAEISGYGLSGDAFHLTAPSPDGVGAYLAMKRAIQNANLLPNDIHYINAHATSTPIGDRIENDAIKKLLGNAYENVLVSSSKGAIGHLLGAAGSVESIFTILSLYHQLVPPTLNLEEVEDKDVFNLDYVPQKSRSQTIKAALCNSFGFGGTNASLCFQKIEKI